MTTPASSDDRRQRAWRTLEQELGAPVGITSDLGGLWGAVLDAYEGELAIDLENDEIVDQFVRRIWGVPQNPDGQLFAQTRAALQAFLGLQ